MTSIQNSYGHSIYRCECGFEAWGRPVMLHECANPDHGAMVFIGSHQYNRFQREWIFVPAKVKELVHG